MEQFDVPFFHYLLLVFMKNTFSPKFDMPYLYYLTLLADTQKDYFCQGTGIWIWKCPDNLFGQIRSIKGYKCKYYYV